MHISRIIIFGFLMLLHISTARAQASENLLTNPGFEIFPTGRVDIFPEKVLGGWRMFSLPGAEGSFKIVTPGHKSEKALMMSKMSRSSDSAVDRNPDLIPIKPGGRFVASIWAKSDARNRLRLTLTAYNESKEWLNVQTSQSYRLSPEFAEYRIDYIPPQNAKFIGYALRVDGIGTATVDNAFLTEFPSAAPLMPVITYPDNDTVDSLQPTIGFCGAGHDRVEVSVWQDGSTTKTITSQTDSFSVVYPDNLLPSAVYNLKLRIHNSDGWSPFSKSVTFHTPSKPTVKILSPTNADHLRGPDTKARWQISSSSEITAIQVSLDDRELSGIKSDQTTLELAKLTPGVHKLTVTAKSKEGIASASSAFHVYITPQKAGVLYYYDLSYVMAFDMKDPVQRALQYDICNAVSALQGLVNRKGPRLFIKLLATDDPWLDILRQPGSWLEKKTVQKLPDGVDSLPKLFEVFKDDFKGSVIWDPNVYSTSSVAATVAGCENLIPLRWDSSESSVFSRLIKLMPTRINLKDRFTGAGTVWQTNIPSTGSKKCDAYAWAIEKYLKTGKCNPGLLLYAIDGYWLKCDGNLGHQLTNRDYIIQNKGFVFDLSVWADEKPIDDPNQSLGTDLTMFKDILLNAAKRQPGMVHMVGFVPWPFKYTNWLKAGGKHDPVPSEWECAAIISEYNAFMDADTYGPADVTNCSIYSLFPLPDRLAQNPRLSVIDLRKLGYLSKDLAVSPLNYLHIYLGDYDAGAWVVDTMLEKWSDAHRADTPLSWAINPNHLERIGAVYEYLVRTRTATESFIAGDSGAGYVNPTSLLGKRESDLPDAGQKWVDQNLRFNRIAQIKHTGFLLNGKCGPITREVEEIYTKITPDGYWSQGLWIPEGDHLYKTMPALLNLRDLTHDPDKDAKIIQPSSILGAANFLTYRTIRVSPTYVNTVASKIRALNPAIPWALLDAPTYASLASTTLGHVPDGRATYTFDTIPGALKSGKVFAAQIGVRNDGWKTWNKVDRPVTSLCIGFYNAKGSLIYESEAALPCDVEPSQGMIIKTNIKAPSKPGVYTIRYQLRTGNTLFTELGDYAWEKRVKVIR